MPYTRRVEIYAYTETIIEDENGVEVDRARNMDDYWYDTQSVEQITDEEAEEYL